MTSCGFIQEKDLYLASSPSFPSSTDMVGSVAGVPKPSSSSSSSMSPSPRTDLAVWLVEGAGVLIGRSGCAVAVYAIFVPFLFMVQQVGC